MNYCWRWTRRWIDARLKRNDELSQNDRRRAPEPDAFPDGLRFRRRAPADRRAHGDTHTDVYADRRTHGDTGSDVYADRRTHGDTAANLYAVTISHARADADVYAVTVSHPHADAKADTDTVVGRYDDFLGRLSALCLVLRSSQ